jgi:uncharacterized protein (UPF0548 family)
VAEPFAVICQTGPVPIRVRSSNRALADLLSREATGQELTYLEIGASLESQLPAGYHHSRAIVDLGVGEQAFSLGCDALREWAGHAYLGITITPDHAPLETGVVVVAEVPLGPVVVFAPCRIVSVISEATRFGFAYGTLPGHPERGEESFIVRQSSDGLVRFEVAAFSRPSSNLVRLGGPIPRWIQQRATRGYLEGVRRFVAAKPA